MTDTRADAGVNSLILNFAEPPKEYSPVPIWWWSGERLDRERLRWQLQQLAQGGIFNVVLVNLAPTGPLFGCDPDDPPFMSDEWWSIFFDVCEEARRLGVRIWFYDQLGFSGANFQGVVARETPEFAGQSLESIAVDGDEPVTLAFPSECIPLAAAMVPLGADHQPNGDVTPLTIEANVVRAPGGHARRVRLVYAVRRGFDYYDPDACAHLRDKVHGEYERRAGHLLGDVIVGSFQDELPSMPTWSRHFAAAFKALKGYDLVPNLPALWDGASPAVERLRVDYQQVRAELAEEAFFKPLFQWHARHDLLCGFDQQGPARSGHPIAGVQFYANYLQTHRWFTAPGSDHHGDAKIHSSLAHLYQRPRTWIESFHSTGWGGTLEETFDWLLPWLRAGANLYDPHAVYYSTKGGWWEWAPPSTCWRQPYWRHYPLFSKAVTRLCYVLSQGQHVCNIGVLYPTTTVQAGLAPSGDPGPGTAAAHAAYQAIVGSMIWYDTHPGVLDRDRRDYDVLDDASIQRAEIIDGMLRIGAESYRAVVLPACSTLDASTADVLARFVAAGGQLIAIGQAPRHFLGDTTKMEHPLARLCDEGRVRVIETAEQLPEALTDLPRLVDAPVPTLRRRIDGHDVVFVPAASPGATQLLQSGNFLDVSYRFDPSLYHRPMRVTVRDVTGAPELWDPLTGTRQRMSITAGDEGVTVEIPFDTGPAALLVWTNQVAANLPAIGGLRTETLNTRVDGPWEVELVPTTDNRFGDLGKPNQAGPLPVQTWQFQHRVELVGEGVDAERNDGIAAGWQQPSVSADGWQLARATFGVYGWWTGPRPASELPDPLQMVSGADVLATAGWQPAVYSLSRGIPHDPIHRFTLGPKGHVPEDFLLFGPVIPGQAVQFRTAVWMPEAADVHLALGAPAAKRAWVNGREIGDAPAGYLWLAPVRLHAGLNLLEFRLTAEELVDLRGYWALVRDAERFRRPDWIQASDTPRKHSLLRFTHTFELPFAPQRATIQVGSDAPCRIMVNEQEIGRQGGFDPAHTNTRVLPYAIANLRQGRNDIVLIVEDTGLPVSVIVDGLACDGAGRCLAVMSDARWMVQRDDGPGAPAQPRRRIWSDLGMEAMIGVPMNMDPAFTHLYRRPHPLPQASWLEESPADGTVLDVTPDAFGGQAVVQWLRWTIPPGATEMALPLHGKARLWVNGEEVSVQGNQATLPGSGMLTRVAALRIDPEPGRNQGGLLDGPITYRVGVGRMVPGMWADQGLSAYSGGVRYRTNLNLDAVPPGALWLDLGRVRGTAEVTVNGQLAGVRIWSPYRFDVTSLVHAGQNEVEVRVLNTLAPYLSAHSPTFYTLPGQTDSGLIGPVEVYKVSQ